MKYNSDNHLNKRKENRSIIYLYIKGGCGNQFFQYAFARYIQERVNGDLIINYASMASDDSKWVSDGILEEFNTVNYKTLYKLSFKEKFWWTLIGKYSQIRGYSSFGRKTYEFMERTADWLTGFGVYYYDSAYHKFPIGTSKKIIINGYFESPKYFADIDDKIKQELTPKHPPLEQNKELLDRITSTNSVCVTIKRQDIENPSISDVYKYDMSYFYAGIEYMKNNVDDPVFFIFADDLDWCRKNVKFDGEYYFETDGNPIWEKIRLMSSCKHFIIHNSTFSWWAQHLSASPDKKVLAPVKWMQRDDQPIDIYEDNWLYISPDGKITDKHE